jgi:hypothetical protein
VTLFTIDVLPARSGIDTQFDEMGTRVRFRAFNRDGTSEWSGWFDAPSPVDPPIALTWAAFWP